MPRPKKIEAKKNKNIYLRPGFINRLKEFSRKYNMKENAIVENAVNRFIDDYEKKGLILND